MRLTARPTARQPGHDTQCHTLKNALIDGTHDLLICCVQELRYGTHLCTLLMLTMHAMVLIKQDIYGNLKAAGPPSMLIKIVITLQ